MVERSELHQGMKVRTHRGQKLGYIVDVTEEEIIIEGGLLRRTDYAVPLEDVREVAQGVVHLNHGLDSLLHAPRKLPRAARRLH